MPAYYTVVQYVPNPIADERINVGVIVFGDGRVHAHFLQNWDRVRRFAQRDIEDIRGFADWVGRVTRDVGANSLMPYLPQVSASTRLDEEVIRRIADEWSNSIQFTAPQPSLEVPDALLTRMVQTHLREPITRARRFRDHQAAARYSIASVKKAVREKFGGDVADRVVHARYEIGGKVVPNIRVDMAVTNGRIYAASQSLSFETSDIPALDWQLRDAVYTLRDIGELRKEIRRDVVVFPPKRELSNWRQAEERFLALPKMCQDIGAELISEDQVPEWADLLANRIDPQIVDHALRVAHA